MAYLIAILIYFGIIANPADATQQIMDENQYLIEENSTLLESNDIIIDDTII